MGWNYDANDDEGGIGMGYGSDTLEATNGCAVVINLAWLQCWV